MSTVRFPPPEWVQAFRPLRLTRMIGRNDVALPLGSALARRVLDLHADPLTTMSRMNGQVVFAYRADLAAAIAEAEEAREAATGVFDACIPLETEEAALHDLELLAEQDGTTPVPNSAAMPEVAPANMNQHIDHLEELAATLAEDGDRTGALGRAKAALFEARCALVELAENARRAGASKGCP